MIVKNGRSVNLGSIRRKSAQVNNPKKKKTITYSNGLYGKRYLSYFDDDVNWFNTATLHGDVNQLTEFNRFSSSADRNSEENYSWQWFGYFKASSNENYTFYTRSDDASYVWIGDNALAGFTTANANVNNGGLHGPSEVASSPISLTAGVYYPIRIQFGENEEGDELSFSFSTPTIAKTTNGLGYYYYDPNIALAGSLLFNNQNQFLQLPRSEVISILDPEPFTIEAWIKPTSIKTIASAGLDANGNPTSDYGDIIIGDTAYGGNNWSLQLFNNKLTFYRYNGTLKFFTSNSQIPLNEWTHVAVAYDGVSTLWIFVNGTLDATFGDYSRPNNQYSVITIGNLFNTGNTVWANGAYAYKGYITNLRINDNQTFYQMVSPFEPTAPLKHISGTTLLLLANTNQPIKDSSPGNVTITNVGSVTSSSQYPTVADCSNNDAKVLMVGWPGPRPLTRDNQNHYTYYAGASPGDETLDRADSSSPWVYKNAGNEIARSLTVSQFPCQASWPSTHTATKICPQAPDIDNMFFPSLWLDASTGVNKFDYNYISQIVLSGNPSVTGTYNASSIPTYNFEDQRSNDYSLGNISYGYNGDNAYVYRIITENLDGNDIGYESYNGVNWNTLNSYTSQFTITGFTGLYAGANGTYHNNGHIYEPAYTHDNGQFQLYNNELTYQNDYEHYPIIATKNNDGSFTPTNFITSITLFGASTTSVNGVYTRTAEEYATSFTGSEGRSINFGGYGEWYVDPGAIYSTYDLQSWYGNNDESEEQIPPTASFAGTVRNIGSPRISSTVSSPNGSVTGTITTSNVVSDYVTSWNDQSENARNASSSYIPPSYVTIGGKSFVNFPANTNLTCPTIWDQSQFIGTIFCVARFTENIVNSFLVYHESEFKFLRDTSNTFNLTFNDQTYLTSSNTLNANTNYILETTFNADTARLYYNGIPVGTASLGSVNGGYNLFIGGGEGSSNIAEVIIYNRVLDTSERQEVESYLANKYSISLF